MNKRIQQLAEQAELTQGVWAVPDFILERFAQLIVRECANIDFRMNLGLSGDECYEISNLIKKHFGVEQ